MYSPCARYGQHFRSKRTMITETKRSSSSNILAEAVARKKLLLQDISFLNGVISSLSQSPAAGNHSASVPVSSTRCRKLTRAEVAEARRRAREWAAERERQREEQAERERVLNSFVRHAVVGNHPAPSTASPVLCRRDEVAAELRRYTTEWVAAVDRNYRIGEFFQWMGKKAHLGFCVLFIIMFYLFTYFNWQILDIPLNVRICRV